MSNVVEFIIRTQDKVSGALSSMAGTSTVAKGALDKLSQSNKQLTGMMNTTAGAAKNLGGEMSKFSSLRDSMSGALDKGFDAMKSQLPEGVESVFMNLSGLLINPWTIAGAAATGAFMLGMKSSAAREDFSKTLGVDQGSKVYEDVRKLRAFLGDDALTGGKSLADAGTGADKIAPMLAQIGDVAGGSKEKFGALTDAFSQVQKDGKLTTDSLGKLMDNGFKPLTLLQSKFGGTAEQWQKKLADGKISANDLSGALEYATAKGGVFEGALAKLSNTPTGIWNQITNKVQILGETFGERLVPIVSKGTEMLGNGLMWVFNIVDYGVNLFTKLAMWVDRNSDAFYALAGGVGAMVLVYKTFQAWQVLSYAWMMRETIGATVLATAKGGLAAVTGVLTIAQMGLNAAFLANPIGLVVAGIGLLVGSIIYAWNHFEGFRKVVFTLWETFKVVFGAISGIFKQTFAPIGEAISAIERKDWGGLAKAAGKLIYNLSPVGMTMNTVGAVKGGALSGLSDVGAKGDAAGAASWQKSKEEKKEKVTVGSKEGDIMKKYQNSEADKTKPGAKTAENINAISGGGVKNITITVGKMIESFSVTIIEGTKDMVDNIEHVVEEAMTRTIASASNK